MTDTVWEYVNDKLIQHKMNPKTNITICGRTGWPPPYDEDQDIWFGDHDRPDAVILCESCEKHD